MIYSFYFLLLILSLHLCCSFSACCFLLFLLLLFIIIIILLFFFCCCIANRCFESTVRKTMHTTTDADCILGGASSIKMNGLGERSCLICRKQKGVCLRPGFKGHLPFEYARAPGKRGRRKIF